MVPFGVAEWGTRKGQVGLMAVDHVALRPKRHYMELTRCLTQARSWQLIPSQDTMRVGEKEGQERQLRVFQISPLPTVTCYLLRRKDSQTW